MKSMRVVAHPLCYHFALCMVSKPDRDWLYVVHVRASTKVCIDCVQTNKWLCMLQYRSLFVHLYNTLYVVEIELKAWN